MRPKAGALLAAGAFLAALATPIPALASSFTPAAAMAVGREAHTATLLKSGQVLVVGGSTDGGANSGATAAERYDPAANSWSSAGSLRTGRQAHTATLLAGYLAVSPPSGGSYLGAIASSPLGLGLIGLGLLLAAGVAATLIARSRKPRGQ